jgi:hypothetical protein
MKKLTILGAALALALVATTAMAQPYGYGMMGGYGRGGYRYGPGMMYGYGWRSGPGYGPGMMYDYGPGYRRGYGRGYGYGPGMTGPGWYDRDDQ